MDGLVEPSMPSVPSVIQKLKDGTGTASNPTFNEQQHRKSSFEDDDFGMPTGPDKKRISFGLHTGRKSSTPSAPPTAPNYMKTPRITLSAKQKQDIAQAFEAFDVSGTGYLSAGDLRAALCALGFDPKKEELIKLLDTFDKGNTGHLCYADFMTIIELKLGEPDSKEDIIKAYNLFDKEHTGHISFANLRQVATELEEDVNDEEIAEMLAEADLDDDGTLDLEEFMKIMRRSDD